MAGRRPTGAAMLVLVFLLAVVLATAADPAVIAALTSLTGLCAGLACLLLAGRRSGALRRTWAGIGLAVLCGALGYGAGAGGLPGLGYFGMAAVVGTGLLSLPLLQQSGAAVLRALLDTALIAVSLLMLSLNYVILPSIAAGVSSIAHPLADLVLATVALTAIAGYHKDLPSRTKLFVNAGLLLVAVADSATFRLLAGDAAEWTVIPAAGACAGLGLILLAVLEAMGGHRTTAPPKPEMPGTPAALVPYAVVVVALAMSILWLSYGGTTSPAGTWARSAVMLLIVLRQVLILLENRRLTQRLESRVAVRSAELQTREQRFQALVEQSSDSMAILDVDSTVRYQSESIERIFGVPAAALLGRPFLDLLGRKARARVAAGIAEVLPTPRATTVFEIVLRHGDGRFRMAEMTITNLLDDPYVRGLVFNTRDVGDAKDLQAQLHHEAYHDPLTGLVNRALFRERLAVAVDGPGGADEVAILFLDLDGFKEVNDSLGHAAGDELLVQVADRLRRSAPEAYTVARLGGDEFAVIVESGSALQEAEALAARILGEFDETFPVGGRELHVGAGIGIASADDAGDIEQLQRNADLAMYQAKDAGGGRYAAYHPGMHDALVTRLQLAADLRLALDRGELVLHYQPTVDLRTGEVAGFEALVRWRHPVRGMVPPLEFIGVAEATGLIAPLGRWVLAEACRQAVAWGAGPDRPLKMAVNVSVRQFDAGDLADTVAEVLAETGLPAGQLCLEMTESVLLTDTDENLARIVRLKALGVLLAMDDFGTGYSSLAYLRRFPMDVLKIDRSFVDRLGGDPEDEALVRTIVRLGQRFGMDTVAEGIEDAGQLAALRAMGCDFGQGFFLSRPLPAGEAGRVLEAGLPVTVG